MLVIMVSGLCGNRGIHIPSRQIPEISLLRPVYLLQNIENLKRKKFPLRISGFESVPSV